VTPRDVYLVTEHGGRDVTRRKEEPRDAYSREEKIRQRDAAIRILSKSVLKVLRILRSAQFLFKSSVNDTELENKRLENVHWI